MKLNLCIASRGRPLDLLRVIEECDKRIAYPEDVVISVALDDDDESNPQPPSTRAELVWDVAPREDSLGAKYNRAATNAPADFYVLGADDNIFLAQGWDQKIRETAEVFPESFGFVYFGRLDGTLPTQMAIPHKMVEVQGWLFPPFFPFWFHDTWTDEIAHMTSRVLWTDIGVEEIGGRGRTRGLRDIVFWADLFSSMRPMREAVAESLSRTFNPHWMQVQLYQRRNVQHLFFESRLFRLRDPGTAIHFQRRMSHADEKNQPPDARYERIKKAAEELIKTARRPAA